MQLTYVEWVDSFGCSSSWADLSTDPPSVLICRSVGWLLHDTEDCIVIVPHIAPSANPQGCGDMTIPRRAIVKMVALAEPEV